MLQESVPEVMPGTHSSPTKRVPLGYRDENVPTTPEGETTSTKATTSTSTAIGGAEPAPEPAPHNKLVSSVKESDGLENSPLPQPFNVGKIKSFARRPHNSIRWKKKRTVRYITHARQDGGGGWNSDGR